MARTFEIPLQASAEVVVDRARAAAAKQGAEFSGDTSSGTFAGNGVAGRYEIADGVARVTIESKPAVAPWEMVEESIRGLFKAVEPVDGDSDSPAIRRLRRQRADAVIRKHVLWSSGAGLLPIPIADLAAVTAVQVSMLQELGELYKIESTESVIKNFITALTGSMIARLAASLVKSIPGLGSLIGGVSMSVMSGASTYAVGQVAKDTFDSRGTLLDVDMSAARNRYEKAFESGKKIVADLQKEEAESDGVIGGLERLADLRDRGVLTEEEFQEQKRKLLE
jgi:uncharacterized protein (DUF697 family)